ncbi:MAG TPA: MBL fold metallo-hydrolase, partial [Dehalococcoidia bacterium]|nr:MBL fold metallo-hydrolase [Dehalococcoidia bacterium]
MTTDTPRRQPLDFASARNLPPDQAAFFHLGEPKLVTDGVAFFPALGNSSAFLGEGGILIVDTAQERFTPNVISTLRANYSQAPIEAIVYTHGHIDHVTGADAMIAEAEKRGDSRPHIFAQRDLPRRFDRYRLLAAQNDHINRIQFNLPTEARPFTDAKLTYPDTVYDEGIITTVGGTVFEFHHCRGETDDETWVWCPSKRVLCTGDTFVWCSPNAGNPYKVQRYALDWARGLEQMAVLRPLHLLPGHGPPMSGEEEIQEALLSTARFLRSIHDQV